MPIYENKKEDPAAATIAFCKLLTSHIGTWENKARYDLASRMKMGDVFQALLGDVAIGSVSLRGRAQRLTIMDEDLFTEWVAARWPEQIEQRVDPDFVNERLFIQWVAENWPDQIQRRVNPDFQKLLANRARKFNGVLTDYQGEVCEHVHMTGQIGVLQMNVEKDTVSAIAANNGIREKLAALQQDVTRLSRPTGEGATSLEIHNRER